MSKKFLLALLTCTGLLIPLVGTPAEAAARPKLKTVSDDSEESDDVLKTVTLKCPRGYRVLGGGIVDAPASGMATVEVRPVHGKSRDSLVVTAQRRPTWGGSEIPAGEPWFFTAQANCAKGLKKVKIASKTARDIGPYFARVSGAACPSGTRVVGFGGRVTGGSAYLSLTGFGASSSGRSSYARASFYGGLARPAWNLTAYAVCAKAPSGWKLVVQPSMTVTATTALAFTTAADCPGSLRPFSGTADTGGTFPEGLLLRTWGRPDLDDPEFQVSAFTIATSGIKTAAATLVCAK